MGVAGAEFVACEQCGKRYRWKPELAGRRAKCACGHVIDMPAAPPDSAPPPGPESDDDGMYGITDDSTPKRPARRPPPVAAGLAPQDQPGLGGRQGDALQAALASRGLPEGLLKSKVDHDKIAVEAGRKELEELAKPNPTRDIIAPLAIIAVGVTLMFLQTMFWSAKPAGGAGEAVVAVALRTILSVGLILGGIFLATTALDVTLIGSFDRSILRLAAIALGPAAVYDLLVYALGSEFAGPMAGVIASIALYSVLFWALMRMDARDVAICVTVTFILVSVANYAAFRFEGFKRGLDI